MAFSLLAAMRRLIQVLLLAALAMAGGGARE